VALDHYTRGTLWHDASVRIYHVFANDHVLTRRPCAVVHATAASIASGGAGAATIANAASAAARAALAVLTVLARVRFHRCGDHGEGKQEEQKHGGAVDRLPGHAAAKHRAALGAKCAHLTFQHENTAGSHLKYGMHGCTSKNQVRKKKFPGHGTIATIRIVVTGS